MKKNYSRSDMLNHSLRLVHRRCVPLAEALVRVSPPLPLGIVAADMSQGFNEGTRGPDRGGRSGIKNAGGRKQEA